MATHSLKEIFPSPTRFCPYGKFTKIRPSKQMLVQTHQPDFRHTHSKWYTTVCAIKPLQNPNKLLYPPEICVPLHLLWMMLSQASWTWSPYSFVKSCFDLAASIVSISNTFHSLPIAHSAKAAMMRAGVHHSTQPLWMGTLVPCPMHNTDMYFCCSERQPRTMQSHISSFRRAEETAASLAICLQCIHSIQCMHSGGHKQSISQHISPSTSKLRLRVRIVSTGAEALEKCNDPVVSDKVS